MSPTSRTPTHALTLLPVPGYGTEDVLVDAEGWVLTGTEDGAIHRVRPDGGRIDRVGDTGGRPLGLELLPDGRVLVCDAVRGLLALDPVDGRLETLATQVDGRPILVCNNAAVHSNGDIYFSDSSQVYSLDRYEADLLEDTASGRLLRRSVDGRVEVLLDGLRFANGVALAADESHVTVAETGGRSVVRLWLTGERAGERELFLDDLPGYPDNTSTGTDGLLWVTLASPIVGALERTQRGPMLVRRAASRLPSALRPRPARAVWVRAYDDAGALVHEIRADSPSFHMVTGVREHEGRVWLGSLHNSAIGRVDVRPVG